MQGRGLICFLLSCVQLHHFATMYQHMQAAEASKPDPGAANQQQVQASVRQPLQPTLVSDAPSCVLCLTVQRRHRHMHYIAGRDTVPSELAC